ncbi:MAG: serine/threonine-protein kinase, partial [Planctomycetota bacterium]
FGEIAVALGLCPPDSVERALARQADPESPDHGRQIGAILVDFGTLKVQYLAAVLAMQDLEIRTCDACGANITVAMGLPADGTRCGLCGGPCRKPGQLLRVEDAKTHSVLEPGGEAVGGAAQQLIGTTVGGYILAEVLGEGGMGIVFRGEHPLLGREAAIKVLPAALATDRGRARRFLREAALLSRVNHPNVVHVRDVGEESELYFIEMDLIRGGTLTQRLGADHIIPLDEAIPIMRGMAAGLGAAHEAGITHRDVKPGNVLLDADAGALVGDPVRLVDFGLARASDETGSLTATGAVMGTPDYMSPEQCRGVETTPASDVYSCGITFYRMLTGRLPFAGAVAIDVVQKHLSTEPEPPVRVNPKLPRAWSNLVERCLAKNPAERFTDGNALVAAIDAVRRGENIAYVSRVRRQRRGRIAAIAGLVALLAGTSWVGAEAIQYLRAPSAEQETARHLERAQNLLTTGKLRGAHRELIEVLARRPGHPTAARLLRAVESLEEAKAALTVGDPTGAQAACAAAADAAPDLALVRTLRTQAEQAARQQAAVAAARTALHRGDVEAARTALNGLAPGPAAARIQRETGALAEAQRNEARGVYAKALHHYEALLDSDAANAAARDGRGRTLGLLAAAEHLARGEVVSAYERAKGVASQYPGHTPTGAAVRRYRDRVLAAATAAADAGDLRAAQRICDRLLNAEPADAEAGPLLEHWAAVEGRWYALLEEGDRALAAGRWSDATAAFGAARALHDGRPARDGLAAAVRREARREQR